MKKRTAQFNVNSKFTIRNQFGGCRDLSYREMHKYKMHVFFNVLLAEKSKVVGAQ